ncbi:MAG: hypothetical protein KF729_06490 [Sandaracinaceae bacterium]|nr:hypothetical protein [Sandaracinaceae bacterium]
MTPRRRLGVGLAAALGFGAAALLVPEPPVDPAGAPPPRPFVWGQDDVWATLERDFDAARARGCEAETPAIDEGLAALDAHLEQLEGAPVPHDAPMLSRLEAALFGLAARLGGACPARVPELAERVRRLRVALEDQRRAWDIPRDRAARDASYRLLYGSRAALEELLLQMDDSPGPPGLLRGLDEPSAAPSVEVLGVRLHSGDVLVSRGGAPTSAFIARGNDYPGNFSHVALLHVAEDGAAHVIESHIESGLGVFSLERYLADTKLRIMALRLRSDHPAVATDPLLAHRAATDALERAQGGHVPYDFAMDWRDPSALFCSEVAYAPYAARGVHLWSGLSSMSSPGLTRWLAQFGVRNFETLAPSDLEHDPQVRVVAEWREPDTLFDDHVDNAVLDVLLERAEAGLEVDYDYARLPLARLVKGYSVALNLFGAVGPIPEGMSAATGLRVEWLSAQHGAIRDQIRARAAEYRARHGRRPPYWTLVAMGRSPPR